MTDSRIALKSLVIYTVCLPLALLLGYLVANPLDLESVAIVGVLAAVLSAPILLKYHHPLMVLSLNLGAYAFFLPGRPNLWIVLAVISFGLSITHKILDKKTQFIPVPQLSRPLIALAVVVVVTALNRGGFGLHSLGGEQAGGRRYFLLLAAIVVFFALTMRRIPKEQSGRYLALFFLSGAVGVMAIVYGRIPSIFNFIFLFIPPTGASMEEDLGRMDVNFSLFRPFATAGLAMVGFILARYGLGPLLGSRRSRLMFVLLGAVIFLTLLSGARSAVIILAGMFVFQFCLEGLHRTKWLFIFALAFVLVAAATVPFITKLPLSVQRTLAVLPIKVDPIAQASAEDSTEWRKQIWQVVIPEIPEYLLLGKGYAITREDLMMMNTQAFSQNRAEDRAATIADDYHNGPLSIIIPLGIWGVICFVWFMGAGLRVLWRNWRYGAPELQRINTYLLALFLTMLCYFLFVYGNFYIDLVTFTGLLGMSVAFNGGVSGPPTLEVAEPKSAPEKPARVLTAGASLGFNSGGRSRR